MRALSRGNKMLNPRRHEEFSELCTISTDELSDEEWALLQVHLAYCDSCLKTFQTHQKRILDALGGATNLRRAIFLANEKRYDRLPTKGGKL